MDYWMNRGFRLKGTATPGIYTVSKEGQHGVVVEDFWQTLQHTGEWFRTLEEAETEAEQFANNKVWAVA